MANLISIKRGGAVEALTPASVSVSLVFPDLLSAIDQHIACERDLDDVDLFDPAYRNWLDDAEAAQLRLYEVLASITGLAPESADDVPLRRMSLLVAMLVREGTAEAFRQYDRFESDFVRLMAVPGNGLDAVRTRQMLAAAREKIHQLSGPTLYRQDGKGNGEADEFCAAA